MARRRRATKTRTVYRNVKAKKTYRRKSNSDNLTKTIIGGVVYGSVRAKMSSMIAPITAKIPMGAYADEVGMAVFSYLVAKKVSNPTIRSIARAGLVIESAKIGQMITSGMIAPTQTTIPAGRF